MDKEIPEWIVKKEHFLNYTPSDIEDDDFIGYCKGYKDGFKKCYNNKKQNFILKPIANAPKNGEWIMLYFCRNEVIYGAIPGFWGRRVERFCYCEQDWPLEDISYWTEAVEKPSFDE